jgi:hypothetical protein
MRNGGNNAWLAAEGWVGHAWKLTGHPDQVNIMFTDNIRNIYDSYIKPLQ